MKVNIGKNTLGDSDKMSFSLREYGRSTHNLSSAWRSPMGVGTLVPFMKLLGLPGDTFEIDLDTQIMTHPSIDEIRWITKYNFASQNRAVTIKDILLQCLRCQVNTEYRLECKWLKIKTKWNLPS